MRYWWVNQNQTYKNEVPGGFLWSPKTRSDGGRNQFYENMKQVAVGDLVFSFCDTRIKAVGIATGLAQTSPKPDFGSAGATWSKDGWLVPVEFYEFTQPIRPKDHIAALVPLLPSKYSPLQTTGDGLQSVYLAEVPAPMANALIQLIGDEFSVAFSELLNEVEDSGSDDDAQEKSIIGRTDIGATTKEQLVKSRRGQGLFKANVRLNEKRCRITSVSDPLHLRASHIKPWKDCDDSEKLNGCNGLLLAPHIDHLFDKGYISFADNGDLLLSVKLDKSVLTKWGIGLSLNAGVFNPEQAKFLEYHRTHVFK